MATVCISDDPTLLDVEDVVLTFERANWRVQSTVVLEKEAEKYRKDFPTIGSYVFSYKSAGLAGPWLTWPAWYGVETLVDTFCVRGSEPADMPRTATTRELIEAYGWITVNIEYQGIATHLMSKRVKQVFSTDPNNECYGVKTGYVAVPLPKQEAIDRAKQFSTKI